MKKLAILLFIALPLFAEDKPAAADKPPVLNDAQKLSVLMAQRDYDNDAKMIDAYKQKQEADRTKLYSEVGRLYDELKVDKLKFDFNVDTLSFVPHPEAPAQKVQKSEAKPVDQKSNNVSKK